MCGEVIKIQEREREMFKTREYAREKQREEIRKYVRRSKRERVLYD